MTTELQLYAAIERHYDSNLETDLDRQISELIQKGIPGESNLARRLRRIIHTRSHYMDPSMNQMLSESLQELHQAEMNRTKGGKARGEQKAAEKALILRALQGIDLHGVKGAPLAWKEYPSESYNAILSEGFEIYREGEILRLDTGDEWSSIQVKRETWGKEYFPKLGSS